MKARTEDKAFAAGGCLIILIWLAGMLLSLALTGTIIWAIIHIVSGL